MAHARIRRGLRGRSALVRAQFDNNVKYPYHVPTVARLVAGMKAFEVSFTNAKGSGHRGRSNKAVYKSAVVIAADVMEAGRLASEYCAKYLPKLFVEEIRLDDDTVIMG